MAAKPRRRALSSGFTLIEIMVVCIIIGVIAAIAIPMYLQTVETTYADNASANVQLISSANRVWQMQNGIYLFGQLTNASLSHQCCWQHLPAQNCNAGAGQVPETIADDLLVCPGNLASRNWAKSVYSFYVCDPGPPAQGGGCCAAGLTACASRIAGGPAVSSGWGYTADQAGVLVQVGSSPKPATP